MFHKFACHPCAGAMLIFSVTFQFLVYVLPKWAISSYFWWNLVYNFFLFVDCTLDVLSKVLLNPVSHRSQKTSQSSWLKFVQTFYCFWRKGETTFKLLYWKRIFEEDNLMNFPKLEKVLLLFGNENNQALSTSLQVEACRPLEALKCSKVTLLRWH